MSEKVIRLFVVEKGFTGYSVSDGEVKVSVDRESYEQFEKGAKKYGVDIDEALGHSLLSLIENGLP